MDKLIENVKIYDREQSDLYVEKIKVLALNDNIDIDAAKILIEEYRRVHFRGRDFYLR